MRAFVVFASVLGLLPFQVVREKEEDEDDVNNQVKGAEEERRLRGPARELQDSVVGDEGGEVAQLRRPVVGREGDPVVLVEVTGNRLR